MSVDQYVIVDEGQVYLVGDRQKAIKRRETYWRHVAASISAYPHRPSFLDSLSSAGEVGSESGTDHSSQISTTTAAGSSEESSDAPKNKSSGSGNGPTLKKANDVPRGSDGKPLMPLVLFKGLTILSLGTIRTQPDWHSKRYIWPLGFKSVRQYSSMHDPDKKIDYTNEIVESPVNGKPLFRITCIDNDKTEVMESETASGAWSQVTKRVNDSRESAHDSKKFTQLSGPEMFGYGLPTIVNILQQDPIVPKLTLYQLQQFKSSSSSSSAATSVSTVSTSSTSSTTSTSTASSAPPAKKPRQG